MPKIVRLDTKVTRYLKEELIFDSNADPFDCWHDNQGRSRLLPKVTPKYVCICLMSARSHSLLPQGTSSIISLKDNVLVFPNKDITIQV